jgi:hypothetical protein
VNLLVKFGLGLANVPAELVDEIDKQLPGAARLIAVAKDLKPELEKLEPLIEKAMPIYAQAQPLIAEAGPIVADVLPRLKAAWPDIVALLPVAEKVIAFVEGKK